MNRQAAILLLALVATSSLAAPDFHQAELIHNVTIIPDSQLAERYYFAPGRVEIAHDSQGKPAVHLLSTRYVGTQMLGDTDRIETATILSFDVRRDHPDNATLEAVREQLSVHAAGNIELRPLPIQGMPARIVYTPISEDDAVALPAPALDEQQSRNGIWTDRTYSIRLSSADAQAMIHSLGQGAAVLSLSYGYLAEGLGSHAAMQTLSGSPELVDFVQSFLDQGESEQEQESLETRLVFADATSLRIDTDRWPGLIEQIDINERLPPGFAVLEIRCYDFQNEKLNKLFEKRVDIRAQSFAGPPIVESIFFSRFDPDQFVRRVRFPVAVRLDLPFSYRVTSVALDGGEQVETDWTVRESWTALLDVTQSPDTDSLGPSE